MDRKGESEDDDDGNVSRMAGYLEKKGKSRLVSLWHRYWFVLEGQRLAYYESQPLPPVDATSPPKGSFTITPSTSVTASISSHSSSGVYSSHHLGYHEIYILTPLQMITLRTKDFDEHRLWMLALLRCKSPPAKDKVRRETSKKSHRNTSYSLTNLTTIEEKNNAWPMKSSHTMDNRNPNVSKVKSECAGNIIDRYTTDDQSQSMDEDMSSEEDEAEDTFDKTSSIRSDEDADLSHSPEHHSAILHHEHSLKVMNEEEKRKFRLKSDKCLDEGKSLNVGFSVDVGSRLMRHTVAESNSAEYDATKISEAKHFQAQERKMKSRKFFGMKESKRHDVPTSCQKVFKKCKELEMTHKPNIIPQPLLKNKEKQKSKSEQAVKKVPKDDNAFKEDTVGNEGSEFMHDCKYASEQPESILAHGPSLQSMENNKGKKSSKKIKQKKVKNKKDVVHQPAVEVQNNRKSTLSKNSELSEEETKKKKKKIGFFSKMLKGKKMECQEDRAETVEERKSIEYDESGAFEKPSSSGYSLLNENLKEASLEEKKPNVKIAKMHLGSKFIPIDDAEFQRKLQSRIKRIESEQSSSTEMNISSYLNRNLSVGTPSVKDDTINKMAISVVHDDSSSEDKPSSPRPSLPLRLLSRPPPPSPSHDKPSNNSLVVTFTKRLGENSLQANDNVENFISPEFTKKRQTSAAKVRNDYDQVNIIGNMSRNISGKSSDSAPNITHSELATADIEQEFVSPSAGAATTEEGSAAIERDDERKVGINLEGTNDMSANPSVEFAAIQDSICSPSWNSGDLLSNYKHAGSATGHWSPNDSRSAIMTVNSNSLKETSDNAVQKVDELGLLLSELDRINSSPLEKTDSDANQRPVSEDIKRDSYFEEDFMAAYPIRRRRNSDPDYDIPRPHRLPHCHETNVDSDMLPNSSTGNQYDYDTMSRQGVDSIVIEATCFLGPGMDYSFDGNRYFGLNENNDSLGEKNDKIQVTNYMDSLLVRNNTSGKSDVEGESAAFSKNSNANLDGYYNANSEDKRNIIALEELDTDERPLQKYPRRANENYQEATEDIEEKVLLRVQNIDKVCRSERSREVYESDLNDFLKLNESMEALYISRTLNKEEFINISNPENESLLPQTVTDDGLKEEDSKSNLEKESKKDECTSTEFGYDGKGAMGSPEDVADSMTNTNPMEEHSCVGASSHLSCKNRDLHGDHGDFNAGDREVLLRQTHRSEHDESARREHRTLRLSFATTETLIVEEEVLVATLKTTTTTSTDDTLSPDNIEKRKVEQLVDEVVLDMERISDNHFGSMQIESCVQT